MADPAPVSPHDAPTEQTNPLDAGHTTSEYALAKWVAVGGAVVMLLSGISDAVLEITKVMPNPIITKIGVICGLIATTLSTVMYGKSRSDLKQAALANATPPAPADAKAAVTQ